MNGWTLAIAVGPFLVWAVWRAWRDWQALVDDDPFATAVDGLTADEWTSAQTALRRIGAAR